MVLCWTGLLNVAVTLVLTEARVEPEPGDMAVTEGGVVSGTALVNDQETGAMVFPDVSCAPLTVAVYVVEAASAAVGVSVATSVVAL
jgi:hypothetical protein